MSSSPKLPPGLVPVVPYRLLEFHEGALFIGIIVSIFFFGITTTQTWYYFQHYPKDPRKLKTLVGALWIIELIHAVMSIHAIYWYFALNYSNPSALGVSIWSANLTLLTSALITLIAHVFFAWRVYIVNERPQILAAIASSGMSSKAEFMDVIGAEMVSNTAFTTTTVALSFVGGTFAKFPKEIAPISSTALALAVFADISIASSLAFYLHRNRSGFKKCITPFDSSDSVVTYYASSRTNYLINKLIFWAMNTGALTSLVSLTVLFTSEFSKDLIFLAIFEVVGTVYANSLLATLNIRAITRGQVLTEAGGSLELGSVQTTSSNSLSFRPGTVDQSKTMIFSKGSANSTQTQRDFQFRDPSQTHITIHTEEHTDKADLIV
ncbi:hypothetical protein D9757_011255 [Collybiopsis confluens]|uniref:DUF6534 domain-containing protein n=1 Tax=Collybiopsis confluens TaxID=2823264 RepID=A0A8H5LSL4_9AGAR|nr:hypothetical protein D9757_011255 [Collybiopsis confluens]